MKAAKNETNTFIIQIKGKENNSWQGTVECVENRTTANFKSALELLRLMDEAGSTGSTTLK